MGFSKRLRNIALSQIKAVKDRLDRVDAEIEQELAERRAAEQARRELLDELSEGAAPVSLRTPQEIARGEGGGIRNAPQTPPVANPLSRHYRVLGLEEGADLEAIEEAYAGLAKRCAPDRFPAGSEEQKAAQEILQRVEAAYNALKDALDPTAGRFDKLEL
jgi:DnaJ-domain-containing protein 1